MLVVSGEAISTAPNPHISQKHVPKIDAITRRVLWREYSLPFWEFHRECGVRTDFYGIRTPTFAPYEPNLLGVVVVCNMLSRKASAEIRGEFIRTKSRVILQGIFWGFGPFSLEKTGGKTSTQKSTANSNQNLGASRPKSGLES